MLNKILSMFDYNGLPETIPKRNLELMLITCGHCFITEHNGELYAFQGSFGGELDVYYQPRLYIVSNPALNYFKEIEIRKADSKLTNNGVLIYNDKLMVGLMPMINRYSYLLAENMLTLRTADIMLRILALISAPDDRTKVAADIFLKNMEDGKIGSIAENRFFDGVKMQNPPSNNGSYVTQFIELHQYLLSQFYNEIGLKAEQNMKRESLSQNEISVNDDILQTLVDNMLECRKIGVSKLNEIYGTNISVNFSSSWAKAKKENELELDKLQMEAGGDNGSNSIHNVGSTDLYNQYDSKIFENNSNDIEQISESIDDDPMDTKENNIEENVKEDSKLESISDNIEENTNVDDNIEENTNVNDNSEENTNLDDNIEENAKEDSKLESISDDLKINGGSDDNR